MPCDAAAFMIATPKPTPISVPSVVPSSAISTDSHRTVERTCDRLMPTARNRPNSRVRSNTDSASVLAMPNSAITNAIASST